MSSFHGRFGVVEMMISATLGRDKSLRIRTWVADCQFQSVSSSPLKSFHSLTMLNFRDEYGGAWFR